MSRRCFADGPLEFKRRTHDTDLPGGYAPYAAFPNGVSRTTPPAGARPGGCTRDLVHKFYQEISQLNGGQQNRYTTGSDAVGLTMGCDDTKQLPVYKALHGKKAPNCVLADHFFQGAFGGSYLNHQYLIATQPPLCWTPAPAVQVPRTE